MKILFTTAHGYLPQTFGGLQNDIDQLSRELANKGHEAAVLASLTHGGIFGVIARSKLKTNQALFGRRLSRDIGLGYPVWRTWFPWGRPVYFPRKEIHYIIEKEKPDLVVVASGEAVRIAQAVKEAGVPVLLSLVDVEFQDHGGSFKDLRNIPGIANSRFTATKYRNAFGVEPTVIYPFISKDRYVTVTTRENITFINPVAQKGVDLALKIARLCPGIPFSFIESWQLSAGQRVELKGNLSSLPNVTLMPPQNDMRKIYGKCKILLVPSLWEEAYGRIATEAQLNGIPVIASTRGGLPETVGAGGILLNPDAPIDDWAGAVRKLWENDALYASLAAKALEHAARPEINPAYQVAAWEKVMRAAMGNSGNQTKTSCR